MIIDLPASVARFLGLKALDREAAIRLLTRLLLTDKAPKRSRRRRKVRRVVKARRARVVEVLPAQPAVTIKLSGGRKTPQYASKKCGCGRIFTPAGARQIRCDTCRADTEMESVWDGSKGSLSNMRASS